MKKRLKNKDQIFIAILFHIGLGILAIMYRPLMVLYMLGMMPYFLFRIFSSNSENRLKEVLIAAAYVTAAEVFIRMTHAYFFWETGKYLVIFFILIGVFYDGIKQKAFIYFMVLFCLIPAIIVSSQTLSYDANFRKSILFNISGPITLVIVAIYTSGKTLTYKDFLSVLNFLVYPIITLTVYIVLYNPDLRDIITNTASNKAASGGYGANQVSTILGLGVFILFSRLLIPYKKKTVHFIMMFFLAAMTYRGVLTFSRGGMFTALLISIVFLMLFFLFTNLKSKTFSIVKLIGVLGVIFFIWMLSMAQSNGLIENRYTNKDALGREKEDISTGRADIINTELNAFYKHPFLGIGIGQMKYDRLEETGVELASHNEVSRMLSEHGIFGIIALLLLIITPIVNNPLGLKNIYIYSLLLFWFLTINHSAMRIAAPAFIYGLSLITITREKKTSLHRE